jgi:hypothetical protein
MVTQPANSVIQLFLLALAKNCRLNLKQGHLARQIKLKFVLPCQVLYKRKITNNK